MICVCVCVQMEQVCEWTLAQCKEQNVGELGGLMIHYSHLFRIM